MNSALIPRPLHSTLKPGLYKQVINRLLENHIGDKRNKVQIEPIEVEESPKILYKYFGEILEKGLTYRKDKGADISALIELCNNIIDDISKVSEHEELKDQSIENRAELLLVFLINVVVK